MHKGFEPLQCPGMVWRGAEHAIGDRPPADAAVGIEHIDAKAIHDLPDDVALLEHLVGDPVGVDDVGAVHRKPLGHGRFARANPADEADDGHDKVVVRRGPNCKFPEPGRTARMRFQQSR